MQRATSICIAQHRKCACSVVSLVKCTLLEAASLIFSLLCSNRNAVLAIRAGAGKSSPSHSRLGGQYGEEAKDEDEVSGKERREEDEAPEEGEIALCCSRSSTS